MSATSILIIEDEPAIQELVAYTCSSQGYSVRRADSVRAGREAIDRELPDLVLLDWMLPDKSGIELLRDLRSQERTRVVPVIMLTAKGNEADKVVGLDTGADDYVVKPFSPRELVARIRFPPARTRTQRRNAIVRAADARPGTARDPGRRQAGQDRACRVQVAALPDQPSGPRVLAHAVARQCLGRPCLHRGAHD
jgi:DNA-binding response OmpR family regulator